MRNRYILAIALLSVCISPFSIAAPQLEEASITKQVQSYLRIKPGESAIVAFMDFQCPACQKNWPKIEGALARHPGTQFYPVNFPLVQLHKNAFSAAVAYEIGRSHNADRATYSVLLSGKQGLESAHLNAYLKAHRLPAVVGSAKAAPYEAKVHEQMRFASSLHINKTPTLFVIDASGKLSQVDDFSKLDELLH